MFALQKTFKPLLLGRRAVKSVSRGDWEYQGGKLKKTYVPIKSKNSASLHNKELEHDSFPKLSYLRARARSLVY
jgi:hypothetical protein